MHPGIDSEGADHFAALRGGNRLQLARQVEIPYGGGRVWHRQDHTATRHTPPPVRGVERPQRTAPSRVTQSDPE
eukprot:8075704-Pyramimonas_sp.AAC.1